jgi:hypothetical protein
LSKKGLAGWSLGRLPLPVEDAEPLKEMAAGATAPSAMLLSESGWVLTDIESKGLARLLAEGVNGRPPLWFRGTGFPLPVEPAYQSCSAFRK